MERHIPDLIDRETIQNTTISHVALSENQVRHDDGDDGDDDGDNNYKLLKSEIDPNNIN